MEIDANQIATCTYAVWDPATTTLVYAPPATSPLLLRAPTAPSCTARNRTAPPLGTGGAGHLSHTSPAPRHHRRPLHDGLVERRDQDIDQGIDHLARTLTGPVAAPDIVCARLLRALGVTAEHDDDVAVLVFQVALEPEPASV
ncbi:SpoIIE family protein phosphatase [Kitasatospora griseola]